MTTMSHHKQITSTLALLHSAGFTSAIVTGGVVRNVLLRKNKNNDNIHTDVQILIYHPDYSGEQVQRSGDVLTVIHHILQLSESGGWDHHDYFKMQKLSHPILIKNIHPTLVNAQKDGIEYSIVLTTIPPVDYISSDTIVGINKAYYDGKKFTFMPLCMQGYMANEIYVCRDDLTPDLMAVVQNTMIPKLKTSFPDYSVRYHQALHDNGYV